MLTGWILFTETFLRNAPSILLFLITFRDFWRYDTKKTITYACFYLSLAMLYPVIQYHLSVEQSWIPIYTILHFIIALICSHWIVTVSYERVVLVFFILDNYIDAVGLLRDSIGNYCDTLLLNIGYFPLSMILRCLILFFSLPLMYIFCTKVLRPLVTYPNTAPFYKYLWTIPACFLVMYHLCINPQNLSDVSRTFNPVPISVMLIWIFGTFFIYTLVIRMLQETLMKTEIEQELKRTSLTCSIQMKYYEGLLHQVKKNRKNRHDFRHQIFMIKQYCDDQEYEKLSEYLNEYVEGLQLDYTMLYCEHGVINAVLQYYDELARIQNIEMDIHVNFPRKLPIPDVDICSLFCNAIENALDACGRMKEGKRWIEIKANIFGSDTYTIRIANSYTGNVHQTNEGTFLSSKRTDEGIGVSSMKKLCEKYQGVCKITYDDHTFVVEMMLLSGQGGIV